MSNRESKAGNGSTGTRPRRMQAALGELWVDLRLQALRRRERQSLIRLGAAAAASGVPDTGELRRPLAQVRAGKLKLDTLRAAIAASLDADRTDFLATSQWMRPVVVLRGLCTRAVIRHQIVLARRSLVEPHEAIGSSVVQLPKVHAVLPPELLVAAVKAREKSEAISEERKGRLAAFGGSALPRWWPYLRSETRALLGALWLQLKPTVLPRFPALVGLAVGWWVAATYTDSHVRSMLHSLGIGGGGRRVVSGDTYRAMVFWLPLLGAAMCAYLADRARFVIYRRYAASPRSPGNPAPEP